MHKRRNTTQQCSRLILESAHATTIQAQHRLTTRTRNWNKKRTISISLRHSNNIYNYYTYYIKSYFRKRERSHPLIRFLNTESEGEFTTASERWFHWSITLLAKKYLRVSVRQRGLNNFCPFDRVELGERSKKSWNDNCSRPFIILKQWLRSNSSRARSSVGRPSSWSRCA
jgi:hypothetical protein